MNNNNLNNSLYHKNNKEQQILKSEKLEPVEFWHFDFKMWLPKELVVVDRLLIDSSNHSCLTKNIMLCCNFIVALTINTPIQLLQIF